MTEYFFSSITTEAFKNIALSFNMRQYIEPQKIVYSSDSIEMSIYFDNFFEINIWFKFCNNESTIWLSLEDLAIFLNVDKNHIIIIRNNQISCEQYYKDYIGQVSNICTRILNQIHLNEKSILDCYKWKLEKQEKDKVDAKISHSECILDKLWKNKQYMEYLDFYSKNLIVLNQSSKWGLIDKREKYIRAKCTGDG